MAAQAQRRHFRSYKSTNAYAQGTEDLMRFFGRRKPNVKSLAKSGKVDGLVEASQYRETFTAVDGVRVDAGAPIREQAVLALGEASQDDDREAVVKRLSEALSDPVDRVRCAAVMTLYGLEEAAPLADALPVLPTEDGQVRDMAIRALAAMREPGTSARVATAFLYRADQLALGDADCDVIAMLINEEGDPAAARAVIELAVAGLAHERRAVAFRSEELLGRLAPASLDILVEELNMGNASHRAAALLGRMKDSRALQPLVSALDHPDPRVRSESCAALGELRDPAAAEPLLLATRDSEYEVRASAGEALDRLGTAALAVSVATLLRPLIEAQAPAPYVLPAINGHVLPEGDDSVDWDLVLEEPETEPAPPKRVT
jgi:HEAT repeat protein